MRFEIYLSKAIDKLIRRDFFVEVVETISGRHVFTFRRDARSLHNVGLYPSRAEAELAALEWKVERLTDYWQANVSPSEEREGKAKK